MVNISRLSLIGGLDRVAEVLLSNVNPLMHNVPKW